MEKNHILFVSLFAILMAISMITVTGAAVFGPVIIPPMQGKSSVSVIAPNVPSVVKTTVTPTSNATMKSSSCSPGQPCYQKNVVGVKYWGFNVPPPQMMSGSFIYLPGMPNIPMP